MEGCFHRIVEYAGLEMTHQDDEVELLGIFCLGSTLLGAGRGR